MRYLHTMVRVRDLPAALRFFCDGLGLRELRRRDHAAGRFTLVFLGTEVDGPELELTHNWDHDAAYTVGRNFGHVAYEVEDIERPNLSLLADALATRPTEARDE